MTAKWTVDVATPTCRERSPRASGGTRVTCPICHEHRPAVVLVPCGHVVCRDCHRSKAVPVPIVALHGLSLGDCGYCGCCQAPGFGGLDFLG